MKPITLTPAQLDAALGDAMPCGFPASNGNPCALLPAHAGPCVASATVGGGAARAGKTASMPAPILRPRLECTCAERDYGLCPNCR